MVDSISPPTAVASIAAQRLSVRSGSMTSSTTGSVSWNNLSWLLLSMIGKKNSSSPPTVGDAGRRSSMSLTCWVCSAVRAMRFAPVLAGAGGLPPPTPPAPLPPDVAGQLKSIATSRSIAPAILTESCRNSLSSSIRMPNLARSPSSTPVTSPRSPGRPSRAPLRALVKSPPTSNSGRGRLAASSRKSPTSFGGSSTN